MHGRTGRLLAARTLEHLPGAPPRHEPRLDEVREEGLLARVRAHLRVGHRGERREGCGKEEGPLARVRAHLAAANVHEALGPLLAHCSIDACMPESRSEPLGDP